MSYRNLALAFAVAALTSPFMTGPAYALNYNGFTFPTSGQGSFSYVCGSTSPVGSNYSTDNSAQSFTADVGALTCIFKLDNGNTVTVPFSLNVTYYNVDIQQDGSRTTRATNSPRRIDKSSFRSTGSSP